jgi:solute carrier family 66 (lysosomal lysine-arginine transporter), member 1
MDGPLEHTPLLHSNGNIATYERERRSSGWSSIDATHLSPVTPLIDVSMSIGHTTIANQRPTTWLQATLFNLFAILMVCAAGIFGWWVSNYSQGGHRRYDSPRNQLHQPNGEHSFSLWGQIFGYLCAALYLGSRIPQILLNYRRKSTDGVSMLFFLFACIGNLTYVLSIFAFEAHCQGPNSECEDGEAGRIYGHYILVNTSWLAGSLGTLLLDLSIFVQFFLYRPRDDESIASDVDEDSVDGTDDRHHNYNSRTGANGRASYDDRPLLQRDDSVF